MVVVVVVLVLSCQFKSLSIDLAIFHLMCSLSLEGNPLEEELAAQLTKDNALSTARNVIAWQMLPARTTL